MEGAEPPQARFFQTFQTFQTLTNAGARARAHERVYARARNKTPFGGMEGMEGVEERQPAKSLRSEMPQVSAWIDDLRSAFGAEVIEAQIRRGLKGEPVFFASENGIERGTRLPTGGVAFTIDADGVGREVQS